VACAGKAPVAALLLNLGLLLLLLVVVRLLSFS
jgi:hypothetical protein